VVDLQYLGRGNTGGDLVVTLPKERIAIAGDLLVMPFPFLLGGFPSEWSRTLGRLDDLDASVVVPGHGAVLAGDDARSYVRLIRDLLGVVSKAVQEEAFRRDNGSAHLEAIKAAVATRADVLAIRARFAARNAALLESFDGSLPALVTSAYREAWGG
jgi:glyoxylase-like metal-dependent hydrolase (beta-lactamase superfamily II)